MPDTRARLAWTCLLVALATMPAIAAGTAYPGGLRPPLDQVLASAGADELVPVSVVLKERAPRERVRLAAAGLDRGRARREVVSLLKATAAGTQGPLLARLRALAAEGRVSRIRPLWVGNVVGVDATPEVVRRIAARPEVDWVNYNPKVDVSLGADRFDRSGPADPLAPPAGPDEIECGVDHMRAPDVWNGLGVTGDGAVIAVIDSGVCWSHPDIVSQVWVNPGEDLDGDGVVMDADDMNGADDDGNGFVDDLVGWDFDQNDNAPSDDNSHGSHCAGTVAGDGTSGTQAGMAPDARIMIVRVGLNFSDEVDVWSAMQYAADNGADAISMSLGWPHDQNPDRATWRQNAENTIDAGTAMVVAAGNESGGNEPDNVRTPGDVPRVITIGAVDCNDQIAGFSSRGPVTWQDVPTYGDYPYPPGLIKPDVAGPGVSTKSHNVCAGYSTKSGTSMATPHVAGAVALMKSANPGLSPDAVKQVLQDTAVDLGAPGKDVDFGSGRVDAFEAVNAVFGLTVEEVTVLDGDPGLANGDGGLDTGEIVTLVVTLKNQRDDVAATGVRGYLSTTTPGVRLVHDYAEWPDVAPLGLEQSLSPHLSVRIDQGCNYAIDFRLTLRYDGRETRSAFRLRVGTPYARTLMQHDFETAQGWSVSGDAATGIFVREDPVEVQDGLGNVVQPDDDASADPGHVCWVTGNDDQVAGDDDVDGGVTAVTSPVVDATDFDSASFGYWRWFNAFPTTAPSTDFFRALWSRDGQNWTLIEELGASAPAWTALQHAAPPSAFGPGLRLRFEVEDQALITIDSVVEGLIDEVTFAGQRIECDTFEPPPAAAPNPVGDTLRVRRVADDLRLEWLAPAADAQHDPATFYRLWESDRADGGFAEDGLSVANFHVEQDAALSAGTVYYLVVSENGGGSSGEGP